MLEKTVSSFIEKHSSLKKKCILGVSGGVDSMVMLFILKKLNIEVSAVHYNYQLRGEEANLDEQLVEGFCSEKDIPFYKRKQDANLYS